MAAKQKKKSVVAPTDATRRGEPRIVFPASMTGSKPKVSTVASDQQKTKATEAEARKRKIKRTTDDAPPPKKRKTRKKDRATPREPLVVEPIACAPPPSDNQERQLIVHEPASTEAPEEQEVPVVIQSRLKTLVPKTM